MYAHPWTRLPALAALACLLTPTGIPAQATPKPVTPLENGDKVLFIGNSFSDWFGPLPSAIQAIIRASGSGLDVDFTFKVKGMGILKEYATWSSLGMVDEIRKGGWKYVVIQGWEDAISRKDSQTDEAGNPISDYLGWPACQDTMLKYLRVLDNEVTAVGGTTILYEPHVGASGYLTNLDRSNQTYAMLRSQVSLFHAPVVMAWDSLRYRYPTTVYDCVGSAGSFIELFYHDCGHQNSNGMVLDALTFYSIFTRRSGSTLKPVLSMYNPELYEELAALGYSTAKTILEHNNCGFTDSQAPSTPGGLASSNAMPDAFVLTWAASTDNVGVLGYHVFRDGTPVDTVAVARCVVSGLAPATQYAMTVEAFDSEGNTSGRSTALNVTTGASVAIDTNGVLLSWDFQGLGGTQSVVATLVMPGISSTPPSGTIDAGTVFHPIAFNGGNSFSMTGQTATSLPEAISTNQYFTFSIAPLAGNTISIDSVKLRPFSQNQDRNFTLMSSVAGFTSGVEIATVVNGPSATFQSVAVSGHGSLSSAVEFRVYVWGPNNTFESFGLGTSTAGQPDLQVLGGVSSGGAPAFPTDLRATALTETGFTLNWNASADAVSYEVFRNDTSVGTTASLSLSVSGVAIGATYSMTVVAALGAGGTSEPSLPLLVTIPDQTDPSTPQNLSVTGITENSFVLHWDPSTDNVAVTRYEVFMNDSLYGNTVDDYMPVPYLQPGTSYSMEVRARDQAGNVSGLSDSLVVFTTPTGAGPGVSVSGARPGPTAVVLRLGSAVRSIDLGPLAAVGLVSLRVTDMRGRTVLLLHDVRAGHTVDARLLPGGTHLLELRSGRTVLRARLVTD